MAATETVGPDAVAESDATSWRDWVGLGLVLVLLSLATFSVPFPGSDSGRLDVYASEGLAAVIGAVLLVLLLTRRWRPGSACRRLILVSVVFLAWYLVVSGVRQATGEEVKQSALVLRTTILPLVCYALIDIGWDRPLRVVRGLVLVDLGVSLVHLPEWQDMRMSDYLGNSMVYGAFLVMLIPLNVYVLATRGSSRGDVVLKVAAVLNLAFGLVMPVWTGSRSLTMLCGLVFVVSVAALVRRAGVLLLIAAVVVVVGATHAAVWKTNPGGAAFGIYRVVPAPATNSAEEAAIEVVESEKGKADLNRSALQRQSIDEIEEDPLFTDGRVYFPYDNDLGEETASPHNFVLEHLNAYGVVGFLLYLGMFAVVLLPGCTTISMRRPGAAENVCAWLTLGTTMGFSLAQPTMMIFTVTIPLWLVIAAMKHRQAELSPAPPGSDR
ncbi:O-antigen ligase family protein [Nocardioides sp. CGMCC 1.13656]|nr:MULTISPECIES: O-antigen ligase family protein [unclassified Nocardioides]MBA2954881.1 O-antigen ligase family protein [Nocardioides sp. CGMCC 1.13656]